MTTTAISNYMDYVKAIEKEGYGYEKHNAITRYNLNPKVVRLIIYVMLIIATTLGLLLVKSTNIIVLLIGVISFAIGILYSFGPIPIYIGKLNALKVFKYLYYIAFIAIALGVLIKVLHIISIVSLLILIPVKKNIKLKSHLNDI